MVVSPCRAFGVLLGLATSKHTVSLTGGCVSARVCINLYKTNLLRQRTGMGKATSPCLLGSGPCVPQAACAAGSLARPARCPPARCPPAGSTCGSGSEGHAGPGAAGRSRVQGGPSGLCTKSNGAT